MNNYWKNTKILMTGGGGFIGSNAVDYFLKRGAIISAVVSPNTSVKKIKKTLGENASKVSLIQIDLLDRKSVNKIAKNSEIIMNFAALDGGMKFKIKNSLEIYKKNFSISKILLDAAVKENIKRFLLLSSSEIYPIDIDHPITEDQAKNLKWNSKIDGYKLAKWESEQYAIAIAKKTGMNITIVRPANIYGPRDNFENASKIRFIPSVIRNIHLDKKPITIWGDGSQIKTFLYVENFLDICASLIEKGVFNIPVNVASKNPISLKELVQEIAKLSKSNTQIITESKNVSPIQTRVIDISFLENKIGKIKETDLKIGLKNTIDYFRNSIL